MMEQVLDVPSQDVITKDNAVVQGRRRGVLPGARRGQGGLRSAKLEIAILNLVMTNIRTVIGSMDLDESLSKRDEINAQGAARRSTRRRIRGA